MYRFFELLVILGWLFTAALFTYFAAVSFRVGDDLWFALSVPVAAWAIWKFVKVGENV